MSVKFTIWRYISNVLVKNKNDELTHGDIPELTFNDETGKFEVVFNTRGISYAARKRLKYKAKYNRKKSKNFDYE